MTKVRINGESFDYDGLKNPLAEALEIERVLGIRYAQWEVELQQGSARALAAFVWRVWRRDGRDVSLQDLVDGRVDVEVNDLLDSLIEAAAEGSENAAGVAPEQAPKEKARRQKTGTVPAG